MLLIKNAKVYAPEYVGKKDLLVCGGKIECIEDKIEDFPIACEAVSYTHLDVYKRQTELWGRRGRALAGMESRGKRGRSRVGKSAL